MRSPSPCTDGLIVMGEARTALAAVDLTDLDNFAAGFPHDLFELHRREAPVWWHEPTVHTPGR